jgi:glycosyltransferase involved in cell wall biosynthesis
VKDGINGYLVGFSAGEMADAIMRILTDAPLRQSLRAGALETVRRNHSEAGVERVFWHRFDAVFGHVATQ